MGKIDFRKRIHELGVNTLYVLSPKGTYPRFYLRPIGKIASPKWTKDEAEADVFPTKLAAEVHQRVVEWLTGASYEVLERPSLLQGASEDAFHSATDELTKAGVLEETYTVESDLDEFSDADVVALDPDYLPAMTEQGQIYMERRGL